MDWIQSPLVIANDHDTPSSSTVETISSEGEWWQVCAAEGAAMAAQVRQSEQAEDARQWVRADLLYRYARATGWAHGSLKALVGSAKFQAMTIFTGMKYGTARNLKSIRAKFPPEARQGLSVSHCRMLSPLAEAQQHELQDWCCATGASTANLKAKIEETNGPPPRRGKTAPPLVKMLSQLHKRAVETTEMLRAVQEHRGGIVRRRAMSGPLRQAIHDLDVELTDFESPTE